MSNFFKILSLILLFNISSSEVNSQTAGKDEISFPITTAVPFLRIAVDARSAGMGEVGVATNPDNNNGFHNPAKFAFMKNDMGAMMNFAPWLRQITNDIYLINANGYMKIGADHVAAAGIRYFTLGQINYTDANGAPLGSAKPFEVALEGHYAFRLAEPLSIGASARYVLSDLSNGSTDNATNIPAGNAFSVDVALFYSKQIDYIGNLDGAKINFGANLSNVGTKMSYLDVNNPDYIPTNLAVGGMFEAQFDEYNSLSASLQFDKLLVPGAEFTTSANGIPVAIDEDKNGIPDFKEYGAFEGMLVSFGDNPDGFGGELSEIITHFGAEYAYNQTYFVRGGVFFESNSQGARQFLTGGLGIKYNVLTLDFSYLFPLTQQRSPLDNQMRVSIGMNVGNNKDSNFGY